MMYKGKLTLGDIGVSFLLPEKLLFCTFASSLPTLYFTFILMLMMLMTQWMLFRVDNHDDSHEDGVMMMLVLIIIMRMMMMSSPPLLLHLGLPRLSSLLQSPFVSS